MPRLELEVGTDVLLLETGDALLLEDAPIEGASGSSTSSGAFPYNVGLDGRNYPKDWLFGWDGIYHKPDSNLGIDGRYYSKEWELYPDGKYHPKGWVLGSDGKYRPLKKMTGVS